MSGRVLSLEEAVALVREVRANGSIIVFTNGVFDLLHPGHVRYLSAARKEGDALIVGVNSDRSVRSSKGPDRPVTPEAERAELIAGLAVVDASVIFDEDTPHEIITALQPDVLVKGADWAVDAIVGRDVVEACGGRVVRIGVEQGHSTTNLITRTRRPAEPINLQPPTSNSQQSQKPKAESREP
jgi:rfaE bifunctional protein nucleotidyltransferase chain/domain